MIQTPFHDYERIRSEAADLRAKIKLFSLYGGVPQPGDVDWELVAAYHFGWMLAFDIGRKEMRETHQFYLDIIRK